MILGLKEEGLVTFVSTPFFDCMRLFDMEIKTTGNIDTDRQKSDS